MPSGCPLLYFGWDMKPSPESVGLPVITFLYTLDQVASMLQMEPKEFASKYVYFHMFMSGPKLRHHIRASNIAPQDEKPDWRISQQELITWLRRMGFRVTEPRTVY